MVQKFNDVMKHKAKDYSDFARQLGMAPQTVKNYLQGISKPSLEFAMKILARYEDISADWLMRDKGEMFTQLCDKATEIHIHRTGDNHGNMNYGSVAGDMVVSSADLQELERLRIENKQLRERCDKLTDKLLAI